MFKTIVSLFFTFIPVLVFADSKVVNIAITEYPPFEWTINDNVLGADADTVVEVFMRIGYEAKLISMPWSKAFTSTQNGEFDALMSD